MPYQGTPQALCPPNVNECDTTGKCQATVGPQAGSYYNCDSPCGCYGTFFGNPNAVYDPSIQQCRTKCSGFGGNGTGDCTGNLQVQYGVKRAYRLNGDLDALALATVNIAAGPTSVCGCQLVKTCNANYEAVKAQIGTTQAPAAISYSGTTNVFNFSIGINDPVPTCGWYEYFGSDGNVFNQTSTTCNPGSGTVIWRWWPYITINGAFNNCGGCQDPFNSGTCGLQFGLGCAAPFCACCCGCVPCNFNNFGESTCSGAPQPYGNFRYNSNGAVMETQVIILYRWTSGPLGDNKWYTYADAGQWSNKTLKALGLPLLPDN
jgi:hypothetical protein